MFNGFILYLIIKYGLCRLNQMPTSLRNTVGSMIGCAKKEKRKKLSVRGNVAVLKLRLSIVSCLKNMSGEL